MQFLTTEHANPWFRGELPDPGVKDFLGAHFRQSLRFAPVKSMARGTELLFADSKEKITPEQANERYGIRGHLEFDEPISDLSAQIMMERKKRELQDEYDIMAGTTGFGRVALGFTSQLIGQALDPINLASMFVPIVSQSNLARMTTQFGGSVWKARFVAGMIEGGVGALMVEPLVLLPAMQEKANYGMKDAAINFGFGTILGGAFHVGVGKLGDKVADMRLSRAKERYFALARMMQVESQLEQMAIRERLTAGDEYMLMRMALNDVLDDRPVMNPGRLMTEIETLTPHQRNLRNAGVMWERYHNRIELVSGLDRRAQSGALDSAVRRAMDSESLIFQEPIEPLPAGHRPEHGGQSFNWFLREQGIDYRRIIGEQEYHELLDLWEVMDRSRAEGDDIDAFVDAIDPDKRDLARAMWQYQERPTAPMRPLRRTSETVTDTPYMRGLVEFADQMGEAPGSELFNQIQDAWDMTLQARIDFGDLDSFLDTIPPDERDLIRSMWNAQDNINLGTLESRARSRYHNQEAGFMMQAFQESLAPGYDGLVLRGEDGGLIAALSFIETENVIQVPLMGSIGRRGEGTALAFEILHRAEANGQQVVWTASDDALQYYARLGMRERASVHHNTFTLNHERIVEMFKEQAELVAARQRRIQAARQRRLPPPQDAPRVMDQPRSLEDARAITTDLEAEVAELEVDLDPTRTVGEAPQVEEPGVSKVPEIETLNQVEGINEFRDSLRGRTIYHVTDVPEERIMSEGLTGRFNYFFLDRPGEVPWAEGATVIPMKADDVIDRIFMDPERVHPSALEMEQIVNDPTELARTLEAGKTRFNNELVVVGEVTPETIRGVIDEPTDIRSALAPDERIMYDEFMSDAQNLENRNRAIEAASNCIVRHI